MSEDNSTPAQENPAPFPQEKPPEFVAASGKPRTQLALAHHWNVSTGYVNKLVKQGCPLEFEKADIWRAQHAKQKGDSRSRELLAAVGEHLEKYSPPKIEDSDATDEDPASGIRRARESEIECYKLLRAAFDEEDSVKKMMLIPHLLPLHMKALANRLASESRWDKHREKIGELVSIEFAKELINRKLYPLDCQLANFAKMAAARVNPENPDLAEKGLSEMISEIRKQIAQTT